MQISPINFNGGQRVKIKLTNNMDDYYRGYKIGSKLPKEKIEVELRKYSGNPKFASLVQGILDGLYSLVDPTKKLGKLEKGNYKRKM